MTQIFTDANFAQEVIEASNQKPVLVDFWASWCGPCRMQIPILDQVAESIGDQAVVGKVNVEENSQTPMQYGVRGIPALKIFRNGAVVDEFVGVTDHDTLVSALESHK